MLATGIRRGELLKLQLQHLPVAAKTTLSVLRSPDDQLDPRRNEPQVKTRMREIPLHNSIAGMLWKYVQEHRRTRDRAQAFLITSTRGAPLSLEGVNSIFSSIAKSRLPHLIHKHSLNKIAFGMATKGQKCQFCALRV